MHDRACELYQQIIGILKTKENARQNRKDLAEQVYGSEHVAQNHRCNYYKPRYLRKCNMKTHRTFAFQKGIPEWNDKNKIHLIGHSLGCQTIRHLQYLLKIGYFDDEYKGIDRSSWIASMTCISPPFNGAPITQNFGYVQKTNKFKKNSWGVKLLKYKVIMANLLSQGGTQNCINEEIIKQTVRF